MCRMSFNIILILNDDYIYICSCGIVDLNFMFDVVFLLCFFYGFYFF